MFKFRDIWGDTYITKALLDFIGWSIFSYIAISLNVNMVLVSVPLFLYLFYTSFALAYMRSNILIDLNSISFRATHIIESMINTEIMIEETNRNLYKRRRNLLILEMTKLGEMYNNLEKSLEIFENMKPETMKKTSVFIKKAVELKHTKLFLEEKDD